MRVLVTGVSGTIGGAVARALTRRGHEVVGTVSAAGRPAPAGVRSLVADLFEPSALTEPAAAADAVVHAASSNDERAAELDRTVVSAVLSALEGSGKPFVYTSGLWLHGSTGDAPATEDSPLVPPAVLSWRPEIEKVVGAGASRGVRTVRVRPGLVYGAGRGYVPMLLGPQHDGVVRHLGDGSNRWSLVHADDLGDLYALAVESAPAGSVYLGTLDESVPVRDLAKLIAHRHHTTAEPWDPADAVQYWGPMVEAFLLDQTATATKARTDLTWTPTRPTPLEDPTLTQP